MRFLLVEDHPIFSFGARYLIQQQWPDACIDEATTLALAVQALQGAPWDLAIVDLNLPDSQGIESVLHIMRAAPGLPILVLSLHEEPTYAQKVMQHGAQGYLTKDDAPDELIAAIQTVLAGQRYLSPPVARSLALGALQAGEKSALAQLGKQEWRVMLQLIQGARVSEIAAGMGLSPKTVSTYRSRIFDKLGVSSNVELARYYALHHRTQSPS